MQRLPDDELLREPAGQVAVAELAAHRGRGKEAGQGADGVADRGDTEGVSKVPGSQCLVQLSGPSDGHGRGVGRHPARGRDAAVEAGYGQTKAQGTEGKRAERIHCNGL